MLCLQVGGVKDLCDAIFQTPPGEAVLACGGCIGLVYVRYARVLAQCHQDHSCHANCHSYGCGCITWCMSDWGGLSALLCLCSDSPDGLSLQEAEHTLALLNEYLVQVSTADSIAVCLNMR